MTRQFLFLNVFAREIHQRPVTSSNRLGRNYESGGKVRPENVGFLYWGCDPPGKPEIPIFREIGFVTKIGFLVFLVGRIPNTRNLRSLDGRFLQSQSGDQAGLSLLPGADGFSVRKHSEMARPFVSVTAISDEVYETRPMQFWKIETKRFRTVHLRAPSATATNAGGRSKLVHRDN